MSEWIRIRVKDFYKDAVGETEYTYVTEDVYEALTETFRREGHAQDMRDLRHIAKGDISKERLKILYLIQANH